jgi:hypothetical protein
MKISQEELNQIENSISEGEIDIGPETIREQIS